MEHILHSPLENAGNLTKEAGPVNMNFTIPMYNASKLQVNVAVQIWHRCGLWDVPKTLNTQNVAVVSTN
jgi:hypothetical protein